MYLYGASGHAKVIADILIENGVEIEGVYDDNSLLTSFGNYRFLGTIDSPQPNQVFIIGVGNNAVRKKIIDRLSAAWGQAISKSSNISSSVTIDKGTAIMRGVSVNADTKIGSHVILNTNCSIDHDCVIGDFAHISPNAALAGNVIVGEGAHIGIGACVIPKIKIGKWTTVGAGAVVIHDVPDYAVVVGNPAKILKYNDKKYKQIASTSLSPNMGGQEQ